MPVRRRVLIWALRAIAAIALTVLGAHLYTVGLENADKLGSAASLVIALAALLAPYLFPARSPREAPPQSAYLAQVRRIAPPRLRDREAELADLRAFCTSPSEDTTTADWYWWWSAEAWAGKSGLLATFVLNPPRKVDVVSFFITSGFETQNTRGAFIDAVTEQLAGLLPRPSSLAPPTETNRERHLLGLLDEAARASKARGRRLVLVVDGLDEDRGLTTDADSYSIAALLPERQVFGMRVIVSGRPDPPLPSDVRPHHPLRDLAVRRPLTRSRHAEAIRGDAERELKRLMRGSDLERDLLGLVTASGGGLSTSDLADLLKVSVYEVGQLLGSAAGRTFASQTATWPPGHDLEIYGLSHRTLLELANLSLGPDRLAHYRDRIHDWAYRFRKAGWPAATPGYLMGGYVRMVTATSSIDRLVECVTDIHRSDLLLARTGGDQAALFEIAAAQDAVLAHAAPDLVAMGRLAMHRSTLATRRAHIPWDLPPVWVRLGNIDKAEALAGGDVDPSDRAIAMRLLITAIAETGPTTRLHELADTDDDPQIRMLAAAALAGVASGTDRGADRDTAAEYADRAVAAARELSDSSHAMPAVRMLAEAGCYQQAEALFVDQEVRHWRAIGCVTMYRVASNAGEHHRADAYADLAESIIPNVPDPGDQLAGLSELASVAGRAGDDSRAERLLDRGLALAEVIGDKDNPVERNAEIFGSPHDGPSALRMLLRAALEGQRTPQVTRIAEHAESAARAVADSDPENQLPMAWVVQILAEAGWLDRAEELLHDITDPWHSDALSSVAQALATAGHYDRASGLAAQVDEASQQGTVAALAGIAAAAGHLLRSALIAGSLHDPWLRAEALGNLATVTAQHGDRSEASCLVDQACELIRGADDHSDARNKLTSLAGIAVAVGNTDQAIALAEKVERLARAADQSYQTVKDLATTAAAMVTIDIARARQLIACADQSGIVNAQYEIVIRLEQVCKELITAGRTDNVDEILALYDWSPHESYKCSLVSRLANRGELRHAEAIATEIAALVGQRFVDEDDMIRAGLALAANGAFDHARRVAHTLADPDMRCNTMNRISEWQNDIGATEFGEANLFAITESCQKWELQARMLASTGDYTQAIRLAASLPDGYDRSLALAPIVEVAARSGDLNLAEELLPRMPHAYQRGQACLHVVHALCAANEIDRAARIAETVSNPFTRVRLLAVLVETAYQLGDTDRAKGWAASAELAAARVTEQESKAEALVHLASAVDDDHARQLAARALRIGRWSVASDLLARIDPAALIRLADTAIIHSARSEQTS